MAEKGLDEPKVSILIVDDEAGNLIALTEILRDQAYELVLAENVEEALKALLIKDFAVIILDLFLGSASGLDLARLIKSRPRSWHIPIVFLTAMNKDPDLIKEAYEIGAVDFIEKPVDPRVVRTKIGVFAELYRRSERIRAQEKLLHETRQSERALEFSSLQAASEQRYHDLVEGMHQGFVWSADPKTFTFSYVSPRAELILGYPLEQWKCEAGFWLNHVYPEDRNAVENVFKEAQMGKDLGVEHRFLTADGNVVWLYSGVRLGRKGKGAGIELRGLSLDISYMKEIEVALKESLRVRDEFLSIASHELKTPLTPMVMQLQLLERLMEKDPQTLPQEQITKTLNAWRKQTVRLMHLVEDLLDASRISSGRFTISPEPFDLRGLADEIIERHWTQFSNAKSELKVTFPPKVDVVMDRSRIDQVITNLITNAIKYAPGKPIEIEVLDQDPSVVITVRDHGKGISPEDQERIFQRFERAISSDYVSGLGLGLYISKSIVQAHGGEITVHSMPGKGATFTVRLPKAAKVHEAA